MGREEKGEGEEVTPAEMVIANIVILVLAADTVCECGGGRRRRQ